MNILPWVVTLFFQLALNALLLAALFFLLNRLRVPRHLIVVLAFILLGVWLGSVSAISLNVKEFMYNFNMPGMELGEKVYQFAIDHFGDPHSAQAHYTISWFLRIPQIYFVASVLAWGFLGVLFQTVYNLVRRLRGRETSAYKG